MSTSLENAHKIAQAAGCIDYLKNSPHISDLLRAEAKQHAENLHDIATELAGDRVDEVYCPDDATSLTLVQAAGLTCTCEA
jgi:hypothetical protein